MEFDLDEKMTYTRVEVGDRVRDWASQLEEVARRLNALAAAMRLRAEMEEKRGK